MTPKGSAFLYARPELQGMINPLVISHGWTADSKQPGAKGAFGNSPFIDEIEMQGTRDPAAWLAVPAALAFRRDNDWTSVAAPLPRAGAGHRPPPAANSPASRRSARPEFCAPQMVAMPIPDMRSRRELHDDAAGALQHRDPGVQMAGPLHRPPLGAGLQFQAADGPADRGADRNLRPVRPQGPHA